MKWTKMPAIEKPKYGGCLNCPPRKAVFGRRDRIAVGFGMAALLRDGEPVWMEEPGMAFEQCLTGRNAERRARRDPDHDWRIVLHGPLKGSTYQRQDGQWVLVEQNSGFA